MPLTISSYDRNDAAAVAAKPEIKTAENKKDCKNIAGTVAAVVGGIALAALAAFAYVKGYLDPVISFANQQVQHVISFASKSPLHTVGVVVGSVAVIAGVVLLGKVIHDAIHKSKAPKAEEKVEEEKPVAPKEEQKVAVETPKPTEQPTAQAA